MKQISFTVPGKAQPAGSKKAFVIKGTNQARVVDANDKVKPWQAEIKAAALEAMHHGDPLLGIRDRFEGPLQLDVIFNVVRPKGHYKANGELRGNAPKYPTVRPDVTKLLRGLEDALTGIVWRDDAQVVVQTAYKFYASQASTDVIVRERS